MGGGAISIFILAKDSRVFVKTGAVENKKRRHFFILLPSPTHCKLRQAKA
jgi:hypothetical protein